jgi:diguanylate cyclase (GGDEF)-like protein
VVAKNSLEDLQSEIDAFWRDDQELDLISDLNGVVVAAPSIDMVFKSIEPMTDVVRRAIETSRQYGDQIDTLPMTQVEVLSDAIRVVEFAVLPGQRFLQKSYLYPDLGMRLYLHLPVSRYWEIVSEFTAMFSMVALTVFLICVGLFQRWSFTTKLIETAIRDPLTGLHTRLFMVDWCGAVIRAHSRDPSAGFALVIIDLDLFKKINDQHGHLIGDDVLRQVGEIIRKGTRADDLAVRFGGEEFALFVHCAGLAQALALGERVRLIVEQFEFFVNGSRIPVTVSGGVAYHAIGETLEALFARADKKLYEAKEQGRNRIIA